jgi:hypothetical protein
MREAVNLQFTIYDLRAAGVRESGAVCGLIFYGSLLSDENCGRFIYPGDAGWQMNTLRQKTGLALWRKYSGLFKAFFVPGGALFSVLMFHLAVAHLKAMRFYNSQAMPRVGDDRILLDIDASIRSDFYWILVSIAVLCVCAIVSWRSYLRVRPKRVRMV